MNQTFMLLTNIQRQNNMLAYEPRITLYPYAYEKKYNEIILKYHKVFVDFVRDEFKASLKKWFVRKDYDNYSDDYELFRKRMQDKLIALYAASFLWDIPIVIDITNLFNEIMQFDNKQWKAQLEQFLGMAYTPDNTWQQNIKKQWIPTNYELIKNLSAEFLNKFSVLLTLGIQSEWSLSEFETELKKLYDKFTTYRVELISRDQVGTLNSMFWKDAYLNIGLYWYIWRTAQDERVRGNPAGKYPNAVPSHYVMDGLLMDWNDASVFSDDNGKTWKKKYGIMEPLHVGMAPGCRCVPIPYWNMFERA